MSDFESNLRDRLARLVDDVRPDQSWELDLQAAVATDRSRVWRTKLPPLLAVAAILLVVGLPLSLGWYEPSPPDTSQPDSMLQLPAWAREQLSTPLPTPPADGRSGLGIIRFTGSKTFLIPETGGAAVEVTGLGDPFTNRPQWSPESALVLLRPPGACPEVAELHPFGVVERLHRQCDALLLSPDGQTLLLGRVDTNGDPATATGLLELATGRQTLLTPEIRLIESFRR